MDDNFFCIYVNFRIFKRHFSYFWLICILYKKLYMTAYLRKLKLISKKQKSWPKSYKFIKYKLHWLHRLSAFPLELK